MAGKKRYKDDSADVAAYGKKRDKELGTDRTAQKKKEFQAQDKKQGDKMNQLTTMFRAGIDAIRGEEDPDNAISKINKALKRK